MGFLKRYLLPFVAIAVNYMPTSIWALVEFVIDIFFFWAKSMVFFYRRKDPLKELSKDLSRAENYEQWKELTEQIDLLTGVELWRQNFLSKHYDFVLVNERIRLLEGARDAGNQSLIMLLLRSGLIRNFGGIAQKRLYTKAYAGTKFMIEEYVAEVLNCLNYLNETNDEYIMNSKQLKLDFFHDTRQSFGSTALVLQGGSLFGLCHIGIVKGLYFEGLLPRIISGSAVGAAVASLVCTLKDDDLIEVLTNITNVMKGIDQLNHDVDERFGNVIENVVRKGYSQDILIFLKFVRDTIGDLTFEEAYLKTEKILNIVVHPTHQSVPTLLNYITAPNVIIWTAIYASIGTGVLSDNVQLYVKNFDNEVVRKSPDIEVVYMKPQDVKYQRTYFSEAKKKSSSDGEDNGPDVIFTSAHYLNQEGSPYTRMTEVFNVNHFIISLARPYLAPLLSNLRHDDAYRLPKLLAKLSKLSSMSHGNLASYAKANKTTTNVTVPITIPTAGLFTHFFRRMKFLVGMEITHRLNVMNKLGLLTDIIKRLCIDERPSTVQNGIREITIVPELGYLIKDFSRVFDVHKSIENIPYWILVGEKSVWPLFPLLYTRCAIEFALDDLYNMHRKKS